MKFYPAYGMAAVVALFLTGACKKDKTIERVEDPQLPKMTLTKAADDNSDWNLNIEAAPADRAAVWIDLNNNGTKDNGEAVTRFGMDMGDENVFALGASKTIAIYGKVTGLGCSSNELTALDLSKNSLLALLDCAFNRLTALGLSANTALEALNCSYNELPALDVSKNTALKDLSCYYNQLTTLDLSKNTALVSLACLKNQLTALDLSKNTALEHLTCLINRITTITLPPNAAVKTLDITRNQFTAATMQQLINSLPTRPVADKGEIFLLYPPDDNSKPTAADITNGKTKNWKLFEFRDARWKEM